MQQLMVRASLIAVLAPLASARAAPASLIAQILVREDHVTIIERLDVAGDLQGVAQAFPLLLPDGGPGPIIAPRSKAVPNGLEVETSGPVRAVFDSDHLRVIPTDGPGHARIEVRYTLPVRTAVASLVLAPTQTLDQVRLVTRRTMSYAPQIRPLVPYAYDEQDDDSGTWQILTLLEPVRSGTRLRVDVRHLPAQFVPYRTIAIVGLIAVVAGMGLAALARGSEG